MCRHRSSELSRPNTPLQFHKLYFYSSTPGSKQRIIRMTEPELCLYHEKQRLALCAVHAVNNLLQTRRYSKRDFDEACVALSPPPPQAWWHRNPHRSVWGIGDYDVNAVTVLLQQQGFSVTWHDRRIALTSETLQNLVGVLWNVDSTSTWSRIFGGGRHWIALLRNNSNGSNNNKYDQWINLDSDLPEPLSVGTQADCLRLLNSKPDAHILLVLRDRDDFFKHNTKQHNDR